MIGPRRESPALWRLAPLLAILLTAVTGSVAGGQSEVPLLPQPCEVALALSAAPEHLRAGATVYAFETSGYVKVRQGENAFTCLVNRDHPRVLKPTCFDAEGGTSIVPKILFFGEALAAGKPVPEIREEVAQGFTDGRFRSPRRSGVAYMLSRYNRPFDPSSGNLGWFPPHVMFYAPDLTPDDIGFSMQAWHENPRLPMIGYQGPHGYMIMIADDGRKRSRDDLPSCPDWVHHETGAGSQASASQEGVAPQEGGAPQASRQDGG